MFRDAGPGRSGSESMPSGFLTDSRKRARVGDVTTAVDLRQIPRGATLRAARPRMAVLSAVRARPCAATDPLAGAVRGHLPGASHQAGYDSLRALTATSPVRRVRPSGSVALAAGRGQGTAITMSCAGSCAGHPASSPTSAAPLVRCPARPRPTAAASRPTRPGSSAGACVPAAPPHAVPDRP